MGLGLGVGLGLVRLHSLRRRAWKGPNSSVVAASKASSLVRVRVRLGLG